MTRGKRAPIRNREADMKSLRIVLAGAAVALFAGLTPTSASAGCYRMGETGYHWYRYCAGPRFLYPHHRVCRWRHGHRYCYYR